MFLKRHIEKILFVMAAIQVFGTLTQRSITPITFSRPLLIYDSIFHLTGGYSLFVPWPKIAWDGKYRFIVFTKKDIPQSAPTLFDTQFSSIGASTASMIPNWFSYALDNPPLLAERRDGLNYVLASQNSDSKNFYVELYQLGFPAPGKKGSVEFKKLSSWNFTR